MPHADRETRLAYQRSKHAKNRDANNARRSADYYSSDPVSERSKRRAWYDANREKALALERARQYKVKYGITVAEYEQMLKAQDGKCKVCQRGDAGHKRLKHFCVDHCHKSGKVRGLLCLKCNSQLGWYEKHATAIAKYLK